jgi:hypothetical protein
VEQFMQTTETETYPKGVSPITLMRRYKPFVTEFSCEDGHDFGAEGTDCGKDGCGKKRTIRSMRIPLRDLLEYLMQDPVFAAGVRHGPSSGRRDPDNDLVHSVWQSPAMAELDARVSQNTDIQANGIYTEKDTDVSIVIELFSDGTSRAHSLTCTAPLSPDQGHDSVALTP